MRPVQEVEIAAKRTEAEAEEYRQELANGGVELVPMGDKERGTQEGIEQDGGGDVEDGGGHLHLVAEGHGGALDDGMSRGRDLEGEEEESLQRR